MKRYLILLILLSCALSSFSNLKIGIDSTYLLGNEIDIFNSRQIQIDQNGSKFLSGFFRGNLSIGGFSIYTNGIQTNAKGIFIAKFDSLNNFLWLRKIAEGDSLISFAFTLDHKGNYYFGLEYKGKVFHNLDSTESVGGSDILLLKFDLNGNTLFKRQIGNFNGEGISENGVVVDNYGNCYLSGVFNYTWSNNYPNYAIGFGVDTLVSSTMDIFLAKFDSVGSNLWAKRYGGLGIEQIYIVEMSNDNIYISGEFGTQNNNLIGGINVNYPPNYINRNFIAKLDTAGNGIWVRKFGTSESLQFVAASGITISGNRVYFSGHSFSNNQNVFLFDGGPTLTGTNQVDYFIAAYDTNGNFKWNTISQSAGSEYLTDLTADSMGNVVGVGKINYTTTFPTDTLYSYGGDDVMVCSYDSNGVYRWAFNAGGSSADIGSAIATDNHGILYIAGGTTSSTCYMGNDTLYPPAGVSTFFYARLDSIANVAPLGVSTTSQKILGITVYPNPTRGELTLLLREATQEKAIVRINNTLGQVVYQTNMPLNTTKLSIDVTKFSDGIYYLNLQTETQQETFKLFVNK